MAEESGPKSGGAGVSPVGGSSRVPALGAHLSPSVDGGSASEPSNKTLERKITPMVLSMEPKRGFASLGSLKLSLSDAVAQRDQEFGGSASLPRMEIHENDEMATGFYSARGPREFKLSLADNIRQQPKHAHSARNPHDPRDPGHAKVPRRPISGTASQEGRPKPRPSSLRHGTASAEPSFSSHGRSRGSPSSSKTGSREGSGRRTAQVAAIPLSLGSPRHSPRSASHTSGSTSSGSQQHSSTMTSSQNTSSPRGNRPNPRRADGTSLSLPTGAASNHNNSNDSNDQDGDGTAQVSPHRVPSPMPSIFMNSHDPRQGGHGDDMFTDDSPTTPPSISRRVHDRTEDDEIADGTSISRRHPRSGDFSGDEGESTDESASDTDSSVSESSNSSTSSPDESSEDDSQDAATYHPNQSTASPHKKPSAVMRVQMGSSGNEAGSSDSTDSDLDAELHSLSSRRRPIIRPKPTHTSPASGHQRPQPRMKAPRARHPISSPSTVGPSPLAASSSPDDAHHSHFRIHTAPRPKGQHGSLGSDDEEFHDEGAYDAPNEGSPRSDDDAISGHAFETYFGPNVTAPRQHAGSASSPPSNASPNSPNALSGQSPGKKPGQRTTQSGQGYGEVQNTRPRNRSTGSDQRINTQDTRKHTNDADGGVTSPGKGSSGGTKLSPGGNNRSPGREGLNPDDEDAQLFANNANVRRRGGAGDEDNQKYYYEDGTAAPGPDDQYYDYEEGEEYEEEEEWYDDEEGDGDEYDYEAEDYDDDFDTLSISPGSSAMLMMDGGHGDEMYHPIDFEIISVEELIRVHNRNPDLLYMIEVSDPALVKWMCRSEVVTKMIYALCEHFEGLALEDAITPGRTYEKDILSSFSYYLITSSPEAVLPAFIIKNAELFDLFFTLATVTDFRAPPDWTRAVLYLLSKSTTAHLIDEYMRSPMISTPTAELASLSLSPSESSPNPQTRGQMATGVLLGLIGSDNVARLFASLLLPENCAVPWMEIFVSCDLVQLIQKRFEGLLAQTRVEFSRGNGQNIASNLTDLCVLIASKITTSPLGQQLQSESFTSKLVEVVCHKEPHPLASYCLTVMCALFDVSYNNGDYETWECPPIISALLKKPNGKNLGNSGSSPSSSVSGPENSGSSSNDSASGADGVAMSPLEHWAWQLDHPTLQTIPVAQLHDPSRQPFGVYRLQLLKSVNSILKTNYGLLHREMFRAKLVTSVMDVLFRHTTASMIHLNVADTIGNIMYFERTEWLLEWLRNYDLIEKVARAFELAASHLIAPTSPSSPALPTTSPIASPKPTSPNGTEGIEGANAQNNSHPQNALLEAQQRRPMSGYCTQPEYAPHLVSICIKLDRLASSNAPLQAYLSALPRWDYLFRTFVDPLSKQYRELSDVASLRRTIVPTMIAY